MCLLCTKASGSNPADAKLLVGCTDHRSGPQRPDATTPLDPARLSLICDTAVTGAKNPEGVPISFHPLWSTAICVSLLSLAGSTSSRPPNWHDAGSKG